jgi:hypothetical protein
VVALISRPAVGTTESVEAVPAETTTGADCGCGGWCDCVVGTFAKAVAAFCTPSPAVSDAAESDLTSFVLTSDRTSAGTTFSAADRTRENE